MRATRTETKTMTRRHVRSFTLTCVNTQMPRLQDLLRGESVRHFPNYDACMRALVYDGCDIAGYSEERTLQPGRLYTLDSKGDMIGDFSCDVPFTLFVGGHRSDASRVVLYCAKLSRIPDVVVETPGTLRFTHYFIDSPLRKALFDASMDGHRLRDGSLTYKDGLVFNRTT